MNEEENSRLVKDAYAAFQRGDIPAVLKEMSDDIAWFLPGPADIVPLSGQRHGLAAVKGFFTELAETQEAEEFEPSEIIAQGDTVVALGHYRWRIKATGQRFESDFAHVFTIKNGKVVKFREYFDTYAGVQAYRS
ncbi:MAG TPA: nuclear transport factor 2 family protein [Bryobacteraceae bacterium]|nr:nuclear transport factor 2 family protein [Bryobacteraceae bacterium]